MIWNKERETMPRREIEALQLEGLKWTVDRVYERVPYYRAKMDAIGLKPKHIRTLKDVQLLPYMTKQDFRDNYPFHNFAVPKEELVRIHASSGTTGKPTVVGYTRNDLEMWTELMARIVCQAGVMPGDTAQIAFSYGLFTGAFGLHYGLERVGCGVVPLDPAERAWREEVGRLCCALAQKAERVERIFCGLSMVLKGEGTWK